MSPLPDPAAAAPSASEAAQPQPAPGPPDTPEAVTGPGDVAPAVGSPARLVIAIVLGAAVAGLGGWILGEYPFTGVMPYIAGVLFALVVTEVILSIGRRPGWLTAVAAVVCTAGGLGLGVWISVGEGIDPIPIGGWVAVTIGAAVALMRGAIRPGGPPRPSNQPSS